MGLQIPACDPFSPSSYSLGSGLMAALSGGVVCTLLLHLRDIILIEVQGNWDSSVC